MAILPSVLFTLESKVDGTLDWPNQPGYRSWFRLAIVDPSRDRHAASPSRRALLTEGVVYVGP